MRSPASIHVRSILLQTISIAGIVAVTAPGVTMAQRPATEPEQGVLLVARPEMPDPRFRKTVILLLIHDGDGTMGLVLNRPGTIAVPGAAHLERTVYAGGPVSPERVFVLGRGTPPSGRYQNVWEDVWWSNDRRVFQAWIETEEGTASERVFLGYSGWVSGQLELELALGGGWDLVRAEPDILFNTDPEQLWETLTKPDESLVARSRP